MKKTTATILMSIIVVALLALTYTSLVGFPISIYDVNPLPSAVKSEMDMQEGYLAIYSLSGEQKALSDNEMEKVLTIFQKRLKDAGIDNATAALYGKDKIAVKFPGKNNAGDSMNYLGSIGEITFVNSDLDTILTRENIKAVKANETGGVQSLSFQFNAEGTEIFKEQSGQAAANSTAITVKLDNVTLASPTLSEVITTGTCSINNIKGADIISAISKSESLPKQFEITSSYVISGTAGYKAIDLGLLASIIAVAIICALLIVRYRLFSVASILGLWLYGILTLLILALNIAGITLSVPVIAAIITGTILMLLTHSLIYENIFAENKGGKPIRASVKSGYANAIIISRHINYALFIALMVVFAFGTLALKQFSIMLMFSIIISMISTVTVTRGMTKCFIAYDIKKPALFNLKAGKGGEK